jgi:hypothetical protein
MQTNPESEVELDQAWSEVIADWQDERTHKRFIALCLSAGRLDFAGGRYRKISDTDPSKREEAQRRISDIIAASTEILYGQKSEKPRRQTKLLFVALGVSLSMIGYSLWLLFRQ